jgi:hypothetical protein
MKYIKHYHVLYGIIFIQYTKKYIFTHIICDAIYIVKVCICESIYNVESSMKKKKKNSWSKVGPA